MASSVSSPSARHRGIGVFGRVGLVVTSIVVALLIAEGLIRLIGLQPQYGLIVPLGDVAVRTLDGVDLWSTHIPRATDADIARAAESDAFTIVGLGDSIMYGAQQAHDETYLEQARKRLAEKGVGQLEILNLAVPGYNTKQEAAVFKELDGRVRPDLVIVHYWGNDVHQYRVVGGYVVDYGDISPDGRFVIRALPLPPQVSDYLLIHSRVYELLSQFVIQWKRQHFGDEWTNVSVPMAAIHERARNAGARLLILASPDLSGASPRTPVDLKDLKQFADARGIEVIDLTDWVRQRASTEVSYDGVHFNAAGHRIIGERLAEHLLGRDLKDRAPSAVSAE